MLHCLRFSTIIVCSSDFLECTGEWLMIIAPKPCICLNEHVPGCCLKDPLQGLYATIMCTTKPYLLDYGRNFEQYPVFTQCIKAYIGRSDWIWYFGWQKCVDTLKLRYLNWLKNECAYCVNQSILFNLKCQPLWILSSNNICHSTGHEHQIH